MIRAKRIYADKSADDGIRILVERLWPRGVSKAAAQIDAWLKDLAPSTDLRTWFAHDPAKWPEFQTRYRAELRQHTSALHELVAQAQAGNVTLVYAAADEQRNSAIVLCGYVQKKLKTFS